MFTRKLVATNKVPQDLLDKLNKAYIKPGAWTINDENVNEFKTIMKDALLELQDGKCAYCELPLATRNPEIEHIAPKGGEKRVKHIECMFLPENLVYACHNCNSTECKGQKDTVVKKNGEYRKWEFNIVHPYFDDPREYFDIPPLEDGSPGFIPIPKTDADSYHINKAKNTIKMFRLDGEKMLELAKEYMAKKFSSEFNNIIQSASSFRPELI
ncbi:MAG: TIGR02646 family protein [Clostridiales bacterium]|nr:TIGR02646 family protein [Clostridiales bacterium]